MNNILHIIVGFFSHVFFSYIAYNNFKRCYKKEGLLTNLKYEVADIKLFTTFERRLDHNY